MGIDIYVIFLLIGAIGGASGVGIAWIIWWRQEQKREIHCDGCECPWMQADATIELW